MKIAKYLCIAAMAVAALASCDDKITNIEPEGYLSQPKTIDASAVTYDSLPGAIKLKWTVPADSSFSYMKISYVNPRNQEKVTNIVSIYTDSLLIENTLHRYGDYTFTFQAYNDKGDAGQPVEVKAMSGAVKPTISYEKGDEIKLTADQLSTDDQEPTEGPIKNLIDGNSNTFFHTRWSGTQKPMPQYVQIDFKEEHQTFMLWYQNRNGSQCPPAAFQILVSTDGQNWEKVYEATSGLPTAKSATYITPGIDAGKKFTHLRFLVTQSVGNKKYFNLAEMKVYDATKIVNDPEHD
jgi:hypothetical protein